MAESVSFVFWVFMAMSMGVQKYGPFSVII